MSGGEGSIAYAFRDKLVRYREDVEVRGHTIKGHTTHNPWLIYFVAPAGSPGRTLIQAMTEGPSDRLWEWSREWHREWRGERAAEWIVGGLSSPRHPATEEEIAAAAALQEDDEEEPTASIFPRGGGATGSTTPRTRPGGRVYLRPNMVPERQRGEILASIRSWGRSTAERLDTISPWPRIDRG